MMNFDTARQWLEEHPEKAGDIAYTEALADAGETAQDDLDCITETGIRRQLSGVQHARVSRLIEKFAAEAENEAASDSREAYAAVLQRA